MNTRRSFLTELFTVGAGLIIAPNLITNRSLNLKKIAVSPYDKILYYNYYYLVSSLNGLDFVAKRFKEELPTRHAWGIKNSNIISMWQEKCINGIWMPTGSRIDSVNNEPILRGGINPSHFIC